MSIKDYKAGVETALSVYKIGALKTDLQPHQQRVVDRISQEDQPGLLVAHGLGSGKTLTSIAAQEALGMPSDVVVPAALQTNYKKEINKHVSGKTPNRNIKSMQNMAVRGESPHNEMLIVDEAHRAREPDSKTFKALEDNEAKKRLLLTGSPFYNHPADIAPLLNIVSGKHLLPTSTKEFERRFVSEKLVRPGLWGTIKGVKPGVVPVLNKQRQPQLQQIFDKWVDHHPGASENFPSVQREDVNVPMTKDQMKFYDTVMQSAPKWVDYKIKKGLPPTKTEAKQLNAFLTGIRQISNSTGPYQTSGAPQQPKIDTAFKNFQDHIGNNPRGKAVVYSNFLSAGLDPYKRKLEEAKIPFGEFTGAMAKPVRDDLVRQFNEDKLKALLISSAGGEGLDLKGTSMMQILDPHWNDEKLKQVEGRGVRYKSHDHLPEDQRKVLIQRYLATRPAKGLLEKWKLKKPGGSVDQYLAQRSGEKEELINQFRELLSHNGTT